MENKLFPAETIFSYVVTGKQPKSHFWLEAKGALTLKQASTLDEIKMELIEEASLKIFVRSSDKLPFPSCWIKVTELKPLVEI